MNRHFATRKAAHALGYAGLIPFVSLSLGCWLVQRDWLPLLISGQLFYGVAILAFLGGVHWGAALLCSEISSIRTRLALLWGVTPSLVGVVAAQLPTGLSLAVLSAAFILVYMVDKRLYAWYRMPEWLLSLRLRLTCVVAAALALTFVAVNFRS